MTQELQPMKLSIRAYSDYDYSQDPNGIVKDDAPAALTITGYVSDLRLNRSNLPSGYEAYSLRGEDNDDEFYMSIARNVLVNHYADVLIEKNEAELLDDMLDNNNEELYVENSEWLEAPSIFISNKTLNPHYDISKIPD